ncbi:MAG: radical SAM/SPASM domain-containing protein [Desulfobacterales bacterium]
MLDRIRYLSDRIGSPELDWIQVEITSHCNAACIYCPNPRISEKRHMPLALFKKFLPFVGYTDLIYLQGWGEPLLNRDLFEMIRLCKAKGRRVGFTTNGMLLDEENIRKIVDLNVDILCASFAGTKPETHDRIRTGTDFSTIVSHLDRLQNIKANIGTELPAVHIAYLMMNRNFQEISEIPELANRLCASEIVASNLTLITAPFLRKEALFNHPEKKGYYYEVLKKTAEKAARKNIRFSFSSPSIEKGTEHCSENVYYSCMITAKGDVSPCVFRMPTLHRTDNEGRQKPITHIFRDRQMPLMPTSFGNIGEESLTRIWNSKAYLDFKNYFDPEKKVSYFIQPPGCETCYKGLNA